MPELPEVECLRRAIAQECVGHRIESVVMKESGGGPREGLFDELIFEGATEDEFRKAVQGRTVQAARRKGKYMWLELDNGRHVLIHLGMTGSLVFQHKEVPQYRSFKVDAENWPPRFCKAEFVFDNGVRLAYTDPRRWGRIKLKDDVPSDLPVSKLAPDALLELPSLEEFGGKCTASGLAIKALLLDQDKVVSGVGNWVADEILFQAKIDPAKAASRLTVDEIAAIHQNIFYVCKTAADLKAEGNEFPEGWLFHARWANKAKGTKMTDGRAVVFETIGGRTTAIVPSVQRSKKNSTRQAESAEGADPELSTADATAKGVEASSEGKKAAEPTYRRPPRKDGVEAKKKSNVGDVEPQEGQKARKKRRRGRVGPLVDNATSSVALLDSTKDADLTLPTTPAKRRSPRLSTKGFVLLCVKNLDWTV